MTNVQIDREIFAINNLENLCASNDASLGLIESNFFVFSPIKTRKICNGLYFTSCMDISNGYFISQIF
jgi:hypothetical protein